MICKTKAQADRIALAGASKLLRDGYLLVRSATIRCRWHAYKPGGTGVVHEVDTTPGREHCTCDFYQLNRQFRTCKHVAGCRAEEEAAAFCAERGIEIPACAGVRL